MLSLLLFLNIPDMERIKQTLLILRLDNISPIFYNIGGGNRQIQVGYSVDQRAYAEEFSMASVGFIEQGVGSNALDAVMPLLMIYFCAFIFKYVAQIIFKQETEFQDKIRQNTKSNIYYAIFILTY